MDYIQNCRGRKLTKLCKNLNKLDYFAVNSHNWEMEDAEIKSALICQDTIGRVEVTCLMFILFSC